MRQPRHIVWAVLVAGSASLLTLIPVQPSAFFERVLLSISAYACLVLCVASWPRAVGRDRAVRGWIALGAVAWMLLQTLKNLDSAFGGVGLPADLLLGGIAFAAAGAYHADLAGRTSWREQAAVYLDAAVVTATVSAALVLPFADRALADPSMASALLYAIVFVAIVSATVILDLAVLAEVALRGAYALLGGLALICGGFIVRAAEVVSPGPGILDSVLVSGGVVAVGLGTATFSDRVDDRQWYVSTAAFLRNGLPIAAATVAVALMLFGPPPAHPVARIGLLVLVAAALIGVVVRQTLLLSEREVVLRRLGEARSAAERRTQQIAGMEAVGRLLASAGLTTEALNHVVELVRERFGYQRVALYLATDGKLELGAQRGYARELFPTLDGTRGVVGRVMRKRGAELVRDVATDPDYLMVDPAVRSEIAAPLIADGDLLGVIDVESTADDPLDETDLAAVVAVADQLAAAIALGIRGQRLLRERNFTSAVLDTVGALVIVTDASGRVVRFNPACSEVSGYSMEELARPDAFTALVPTEQRETIDAVVAEVRRAGQPRSVDNEWVRKDGARRIITWWNRPVPSADGSVDYVIATGIDITERKELETQLAHRALHDPLTWLPNRALLMDRLSQALRRRNPDGIVAALFIDLDDFKTINDTLGHAAGDDVLIEVAKRITSSLRPEDTAARVGGDEFAVVLEGLNSAEEAMTVAERIRMAIGNHPIDWTERSVRIRASVGVATSVDHLEIDADRLLRHADVAMYAAKTSGGNQSEPFRAQMYSRLVKRTEVHQQLAAAVDNDEFIVHFQPIVRLRGQRFAGAEALVRWLHPTDGLLLPARFIDVAEVSGLIVPIGAHVLREACRQLATWQSRRDSTPPEWVSVNVSPRQFDDPRLFEHVEDAVQGAGIEPSELVIEITETLMVSVSETTSRTIRRLTDYGVRFAVDDFGTGYSSLSYLRRFPIEFLKIDRSFIPGVDTDDQQAAFVGALVAMGRTLGLRVLAEGIETQAQLRALRQLGCELGQGYHIGKPVAAAQLDWSANNRARAVSDLVVLDGTAG